MHIQRDVARNASLRANAFQTLLRQTVSASLIKEFHEHDMQIQFSLYVLGLKVRQLVSHAPKEQMVLTVTCCDEL